MPDRRFRCDGVVQPFVLFLVDVELGAEGPLVQLSLGALVDDGALVAGEGGAVLVAFEEILPHLGPDRLQQKTKMCRDRVIA